MPEEATPIDEVGLEGHEDWKDGKLLSENPYPIGSERAKEWAEGWRAAENDETITRKSPGSGTAGSYTALTKAKEMIRKEMELERAEENVSTEKISGLKNALMCVQMAENRAE